MFKTTKDSKGEKFSEMEAAFRKQDDFYRISEIFRVQKLIFSSLYRQVIALFVNNQFRINHHQSEY